MPVTRLAEVPGLDGIQRSRSLPKSVPPRRHSPRMPLLLVGACPGRRRDAGVNYSHRSPKGNRHMRRVLNQTANAAARTKGASSRLGIAAASRAWEIISHRAIAHRQWPTDLADPASGVRYENRGSVPQTIKAKAHCENGRQLRHRLSDRLPNPQHSSQHRCSDFRPFYKRRSQGKNIPCGWEIFLLRSH